jgi:short-subunit dehydrogenase
MGGLITFPIYSIYHGTKWAVEGFSEALHYELKPLGIKVKTIEPGAIKTDFYDRSQDLFQNPAITDYDHYEQVTFANSQKAGEDAPGPEVVAAAIFKAATDDNFKLRYPVGSQSPMLLFMRRIIPNSWFFGIVRSVVEKGFKA